MKSLHLVSLLVTTVILTGCNDNDDDPAASLTGYVEADYVYVIAPQSGYLVTSELVEGRQVSPGDNLASLDREYQQLAIEQASAQASQALAQYQDLLKGERDAEIEVVQKSIKAQQAVVAEARLELTRQQQLVSDKLTSQASLDAAQASYDTASAKLEQLHKELLVHQLPARDDTIEAAQQNAQAAELGKAMAEWDLRRRDLIADYSGTVEEVYFRRGEFVSQGQPIASLINQNSLKVRFYLPQAKLSQIAPGQSVRVQADDGSDVQAQVSFMSHQPAFMPPILYTNTSREKLVYLVEARLPGNNPLRPGQPVDIRL